ARRHIVDRAGIADAAAARPAGADARGFHLGVTGACLTAGLSPAIGANTPRFPTSKARTMTKPATEAHFGEEVLKSNEPVQVDFWAEWCGPCRAIAPVLEELSTELEGKVKIVKLNVDENPGLAAQYGVRSIPTMILFKN